MIRLNWNVYAIRKILIKCTFIGWSYPTVLHLIDIWKHDINKIFLHRSLEIFILPFCLMVKRQKQNQKKKKLKTKTKQKTQNKKKPT